MATPEEVEEINTYLQAHAQRQSQPRQEEEKKGLLHGLQHALFGETHADYPSASPVANPRASAPATAPSAIPTAPAPAASARVSMASLLAPSPAPAARDPVSASMPASPAPARTTPVIMPDARRAMSGTTPPVPVAPPAAARESVTPAVRIPPSEKKYTMDAASYKSPDEGGAPTFNPPPARFNPYPNPYRKSTPSPEKFSDNTAPPWVMRTLPSESRDDPATRERENIPGSTAGMEKLKAVPSRSTAAQSTPSTVGNRVPAAAADSTSRAASPAPIVPLSTAPANSTRTKVMALIQDTEKVAGDDSPHRMPWHEPASKEISPNELVGIAPVSPPSRAPVVASPRMAPTPTASRMAEASTVDSHPSRPHELSEQERAYLLRKEQEYDAQHARAAGAKDTPTPTPTSNNNPTIDEKRAILGRLKELMAQQGATLPTD